MPWDEPLLELGQIDLACPRALSFDNQFDRRRNLSLMIDEAKQAVFEVIVLQDRVAGLEVATIEKVVPKRPTPLGLEPDRKLRQVLRSRRHH